MKRLALALALVACGGGSASDAPKTPEQPFIVIQPEEARLLSAASAVTRGVGHDVAYEVDATLLKEHAPRLQDTMSDALETIARGIEQARAQRPDLTSRACAAFTKLVIESDDRRREPSADFDPKTGRLTLKVPSGVMSFTTEQKVAAAFLAPRPD